MHGEVRQRPAAEAVRKKVAVGGGAASAKAPPTKKADAPAPAQKAGAAGSRSGKASSSKSKDAGFGGREGGNEKEWDENFNWYAWIPLTVIFFATLLTFGLCWPPAHLWM